MSTSTVSSMSKKSLHGCSKDKVRKVQERQTTQTFNCSLCQSEPSLKCRVSGECKNVNVLGRVGKNPIELDVCCNVDDGVRRASTVSLIKAKTFNKLLYKVGASGCSEKSLEMLLKGLHFSSVRYCVHGCERQKLCDFF